MPITEMNFNAAYSNESAIEAEGRLDRAIFINTSDILTRLIQEAGRFCRHYASDLFYSWLTIEKKMNRGLLKSERVLFGFRENGVDTNDFILNKFNGNSGVALASMEYRSIWILDITVDGAELPRVSMRLFEAHRVPSSNANSDLPWD